MEPRVTRGFASNAADEKKLRALGVRTIYRGDKGEALGKFKMRKGELLGVVNGIRTFGGKTDMRAAVKLVHSWGAAIIDAESGLRSDRDGVEMLALALAPRRPSDAYRAAQAAGVANRTKGRMPDREALIIWRDARFSTEEAIDLMHGWSQATAYNRLKARGVPAGRRHK